MGSKQAIIFATHNPHKLAEVLPIFSKSNVHLSTASQIGVSVAEVVESGSSFAENAYIKAQAFFDACDCTVIADDSGLEVVALNGKPGVHSNRWHPGSYADRNLALLKLLEGEVNRAAQFTTVVCVLEPNGKPHYFSGSVKGTITSQPKGNNGFGYDSVFVPDGFEQTFAELDPIAKQSLSHRTKAFSQAVAFLKQKQTL